MPWIDGRLVGTMLLVMLALQAVCWLLAKGLGARLEKIAVLCGWLAPLVVLAPWLGGRSSSSPATSCRTSPALR